MYLDLDNECMTPSETIFHDYDAVLQGSGWEGVNNGMMASAPGHPMWMKWGFFPSQILLFPAQYLRIE